MVGAGGLSFEENTSAIKGREIQHDPMIMEWSYRSRSPSSSGQKRSAPEASTKRWGNALRASKDFSDNEPPENASMDEPMTPPREDTRVLKYADEIKPESPADAVETEVDFGEASGEDSGALEHADEIKAESPADAIEHMSE